MIYGFYNLGFIMAQYDCKSEMTATLSEVCDVEFYKVCLTC
jgi:hypothetical protein